MKLQELLTQLKEAASKAKLDEQSDIGEFLCAGFHREDAEYLASVSNPKTILALVECVEILRACVDGLCGYDDCDKVCADL